VIFSLRTSLNACLPHPEAYSPLNDAAYSRMRCIIAASPLRRPGAYVALETERSENLTPNAISVH